MTDTIKTPFLSIIVPAYNEEHRLPPTLRKIAGYLRRQGYQSEVLVVENGSTDRTADVVREFAQAAVQPGDPYRIELLHSAPGKGAAVKQGMLAAHGDYRFICDADLAMPIEEIAKFLPQEQRQPAFDIAIASRETPGAVRLQ